MRLFLVRHPKPDIREGICYGRSDIAVAPDEQARVFARLQSMLPQKAALYASPARRCTGLANDLAMTVSLAVSPAVSSTQPTLDARLWEMHFGTWEMQAWSDIPRAEVDAWAADMAGYRPGGGESVLQVAHRVREFFDYLVERTSPAADVIIVCHAGTIRLLRECASSRSTEEMALQAARATGIAYGELVVLDL